MPQTIRQIFLPGTGGGGAPTPNPTDASRIRVVFTEPQDTIDPQLDGVLVAFEFPELIDAITDAAILSLLFPDTSELTTDEFSRLTIVHGDTSPELTETLKLGVLFTELNGALTDAGRLSLLFPELIRGRSALVLSGAAGDYASTPLSDADRTGNRLTKNQASFESSINGWSSAHSIARSTAQAADGVASGAVTSVAAGSLTATTRSGKTGIRIKPNTQYTFGAEWRAATTPRTIRSDILWYDSAGTYISESNFTGPADTTTGWTLASITATSPANAVYAAGRGLASSVAAAGETHYLDKAFFYEGSSTVWTPGRDEDLQIVADIAPDDWTPAVSMEIVAKNQTASTFSHALELQDNGTLRLVWTQDGTTTQSRVSTVATGLTDGQRKWAKATLDIDNGAGNHVIRFFLSDDGATWTQLGATITSSGMTSIFESSDMVEVGSQLAGTSRLFSGKIHSVEIREQIDSTGLTSLRANPDFDQPAGITSFNDWIPNVWTINGSASITELVVATVDNLPALRIVHGETNAAPTDVHSLRIAHSETNGALADALTKLAWLYADTNANPSDVLTQLRIAHAETIAALTDVLLSLRITHGDTNGALTDALTKLAWLYADTSPTLTDLLPSLGIRHTDTSPAQTDAATYVLRPTYPETNPAVNDLLTALAIRLAETSAAPTDANSGSLTWTEGATTAAGTNWSTPANAQGLKNGTLSTLTDPNTSTVSGTLTLDPYPDPLFTTTGWTITQVLLRFFTKGLFSINSTSRVFFEYSFNGTSWTTLAEEPFSSNAYDDLTTPRTFDITSAVGGNWSNINNIRTRMRYAASAVLIETATIDVDAIEVRVLATKSTI